MEDSFRETIARNSRIVGMIARNYASEVAWPHLQQEIFIAFWKSMKYGGTNFSQETRLFNVAINTGRSYERNLRNNDRKLGKANRNNRDLERRELRILEEFIGTLHEHERRVLGMYFEDHHGRTTESFQKSINGIKERFRAEYHDRGVDLRNIKAAWHLEKERYCGDIDPKRATTETKQKAAGRDSQFFRQQIFRIACGAFCLGMMATYYREQYSFTVNLGISSMLLGFGSMLTGIIALRFRLRESHPELPAPLYLAEEKRKLVSRISLVRRNVVLFLGPVLGGIVLWQGFSAGSREELIRFSLILVTLYAMTLWWCRHILSSDLAPLLKSIDEELERTKPDIAVRQPDG